MLGTDTRALLFERVDTVDVQPITFGDVATAIRLKLAREGKTAEELGNEIG
jgi:hypothetical protein